MLLTNILLGLIIFLLIIIFGSLINIDRKLSNEETAKMQRFYKSLMDSINREKETITKND